MTLGETLAETHFFTRAGIKMSTAMGQSIILTHENSHIFFDTPFKRCCGVFCSNLIFIMKKSRKLKKYENSNLK